MSRYKLFLCIVFTLVWVWAAVAPQYRGDWLLENILVFIFVPLIFVVGRYFKLSNVSYTLITIFMVLHVIGSHYTYAEVPFGYMLQEWFDASRNMYDRIVHFSFGFLLAYPMRELLVRVSKVKGIWAYYFPIDLVAAGSAFYEIIEWLTALKVDPVAGLAFLGVQGDVWDAQKDMLMAITGAIIGMIIVFIINWILDKDHWKEIRESLRISQGDAPLGEERLGQLMTRK